jgi:hypothetical protein
MGKKTETERERISYTKREERRRIWEETEEEKNYKVRQRKIRGQIEDNYRYRIREKSQASAVSVVTRQRAGWQTDLIATYGKGKRFFLSANLLDWGPLSLIFKG